MQCRRQIPVLCEMYVTYGSSDFMIVAWEELLNGKSGKAKLSARYLYEHLFLAHLHFSDSTEDRFFRLGRLSPAWRHCWT